MGGVYGLRKIRLIVCFVLLFLLNSSVSSSALHSLEPGMEAPDFNLLDLNGKMHNSSSLKGNKLTVVLFWATWGENSKKALKLLQSLHQSYKDRGLSVVGINVDRQDVTKDTLAVINSSVLAQKISFPVLVDHGLVTFQRFGVIAAPSIVVLDAQGIVRYELSGFPLMGVDGLLQFVELSLDGSSKRVQAVLTGYQPDKRAVRFWNMGVATMKSERTVSRSKGWFEKAIAADPSFSLPYLSLGTLQYRQHNLAEAKKQFEMVLQKKPDHPVALSSLGQVLMDEGNFAEAEKKLVLAIKSDETYTPSYYLLGLLKARQGSIPQALQWFAQGERINPNDYKLFAYKGQMFEELKDLSAAKAGYKKALQLIVGQP